MDVVTTLVNMLGENGLTLMVLAVVAGVIVGSVIAAIVRSVIKAVVAFVTIPAVAGVIGAGTGVIEPFVTR